MTDLNYNELTRKELLTIGKEKELTGLSKMKKGELVALLESLEPTPSVEVSPPPATNFLGIRYGRKITHEEIKEYVEELWKGVLTVSEVEYDGHYWKGTVTHEPTEELTDGVRMDYLISYFRPPRPFAKLDDVVTRRKELVLKHGAK